MSKFDDYEVLEFSDAELSEAEAVEVSDKDLAAFSKALAESSVFRLGATEPNPTPHSVERVLCPA